MVHVLDAVEHCLHPLALRFGLRLAGDERSSTSSNEELRQLEYTVSAPGGRRLRLDISHLTTTGTFVAELWDPADLVGLPQGASADTVAIGRRVWSDNAVDEQDGLVREVVGQIGAWLEQHCPT